MLERDGVVRSEIMGGWITRGSDGQRKGQVICCEELCEGRRSADAWLKGDVMIRGDAEGLGHPTAETRGKDDSASNDMSRGKGRVAYEGQLWREWTTV